MDCPVKVRGSLSKGPRMLDTHESIKKRFFQMMMSKSPAERLRMGCSMFDSAKQIVRSSILQKNPHGSPSEIKKEIFLRFYGQDFQSEQKRKILDSLK